jgi:hypothetical protein
MMARRQVSGNVLGTTLIQRKLRYEMSNADVADQYLFALQVAENLNLRYEGAGAVRDLTFSMEAIQSATSHIVLSQGYAVSSESPPCELPALVTSDLPPFLVSRAVFALLKERGRAEFKFEWSHKISVVSVHAKKQMTIVIEGTKTTVPVLHCLGNLHDCKLWILDDGEWPLVLKHEEEDGFHWKLLEAV